MPTPVEETTAVTTAIARVSGDTYTFNLPSGIQADDVLLAFFSKERHSGGAASISGWTQLFDDTEGSTTGQDSRLIIFYKKATGSEGSTADLVISSAVNPLDAAACVRISGAEDPGTQAPEVTAKATGNNSSPNPPSITPLGGPKDFLYYAVGSQDDNIGTNVFTAAPSGYTGLLSPEGGTDSGLGVAHKGTTGSSSEDPGTFTTNGSARWICATVAVHPAPAAGGPVHSIQNAAWQGS